MVRMARFIGHILARNLYEKRARADTGTLVFVVELIVAVGSGGVMVGAGSFKLPLTLCCCATQEATCSHKFEEEKNPRRVSKREESECTRAHIEPECA
jgi:hypothetical protein